MGVKMIKSELAGLQLYARYAWNCNGARHRKSSQLLLQAGQGQLDFDQTLVKIELESLSAFCYLQQIAQDNGLDPFALEVVKAFWRGQDDGLRVDIHHNWQTISGQTPQTIQLQLREAERCLVLPGRVISVAEDKVSVEFSPLQIIDGQLQLSRNRRIKSILNPFLALRARDWVSVHFDSVAERINRAQVERLLEITQQALDRFNQTQFKRDV